MKLITSIITGILLGINVFAANLSENDIKPDSLSCMILSYYNMAASNNEHMMEISYHNYDSIILATAHFVLNLSTVLNDIPNEWLRCNDQLVLMNYYYFNNQDYKQKMDSSYIDSLVRPLLNDDISLPDLEEFGIFEGTPLPNIIINDYPLLEFTIKDGNITEINDLRKGRKNSNGKYEITIERFRYLPEEFEELLKILEEEGYEVTIID